MTETEQKLRDDFKRLAEVLYDLNKNFDSDAVADMIWMVLQGQLGVVLTDLWNYRDD